MSTDTPIGRITFGQTNDSQSWSIDGGTLVFANAIEAKKAEALFNDMERENACLREELELLKTCGIAELAANNPSAMEYCRNMEDRNEKLGEELAAAKRLCLLAEDEREQYHGAAIQEKAKREQAENKLAERNAKVAWQEVEIADLRDDVKRLMQTVSECEERALANEKDAGRLRWLLEDHNTLLLVNCATVC